MVAIARSLHASTNDELQLSPSDALRNAGIKGAKTADAGEGTTVPTSPAPDVLHLSESNAILLYLAHATPLLPSDPLLHAQVLQWLFWEQHSHEPNVGTLRYWIAIEGRGEEEDLLDKIVEKQRKGYDALEFMEQHFSGPDGGRAGPGNKWLVGNTFTVADISLYAHTHVSVEGRCKAAFCENHSCIFHASLTVTCLYCSITGGISIDSFPSIKSWLRRVEDMPGFIPIND